MRTVIPFNDNWLFLKPGENRMPVTLPHTWNNLDGQDGGGDYWRGECVYEKTFAAPDRKADEEVYLEFDGVSASARATLNSHFIGEHPGGYSRFRFNISVKSCFPHQRALVNQGLFSCEPLFYHYLIIGD